MTDPQAIANETARRVHRAICDSGAEQITPAKDGSITAEETMSLINGGVWGIAAFVAQSVVVANGGDEQNRLTPEEVMGAMLADQFVHAYRAYVQQNKAAVN